MSRRLTAVVLAATAATALISGCTSILPGTAKPESASSSPREPGTNCKRSANPEQCVEWVDTKPKQGQDLLAQSTQDELITAYMLCSAVPTEVWDELLGPGHYRFIGQGPTCTISSDDNRKTPDGKFAPVVEVEIAVWAKDPLATDLAILRGKKELAENVSEFTIAGKPVMRYGTPEDADGVGRDKEELSIAALGDVNAPGVLRVRQTLRAPRGTSYDAPIDRAPLTSMRDVVVTELLKVLFP
ncbi:hypothetical protein C8D87_11453 [Lentzea atacamensis]|uniref:DUF3558 domain-containing protein n=1 Tax=Lentzea atacamensis TaxID=531938 RepID=A0ABX9DVX7_9PSEU|nr:hypothetical protein [Lentzea atacamensis]RAS59441.1 hypothetical protein C8D87_11453 [Lentzea atacamensis]